MLSCIQLSTQPVNLKIWSLYLECDEEKLSSATNYMNFYTHTLQQFWNQSPHDVLYKAWLYIYYWNKMKFELIATYNYHIEVHMRF